MTWLDALLDEPFVCITDMLRRFATERADHAALICDGQVVTYAELHAKVDRFAAALQRDGLKPRDAMALCAGASVEYVVAFLGGLRAGAAVAPLAPSSSAASLVSMINNSGARLLFLDAEVKRLLEPVADEISTTMIALDGHPGSIALQTWVAPESAVPESVTIEPAWPFNIIYSSGTTGTPKGIVQSHGMRWAYAQRSIERGYGPHATTLISTPLYSNTTLVSFMPTLTFGGTVVLMPKFDATRYLTLAQQYRVDAYDARAGPVSAVDGASGLRPLRPVQLSGQVLHQRAIRGERKGGRRAALARQAYRVLRHDRRRRLMPAGGARIAPTSCIRSANPWRDTISA